MRNRIASPKSATLLKLALTGFVAFDCAAAYVAHVRLGEAAPTAVEIALVEGPAASRPGEGDVNNAGAVLALSAQELNFAAPQAEKIAPVALAGPAFEVAAPSAKSAVFPATPAVLVPARQAKARNKVTAGFAAAFPMKVDPVAKPDLLAEIGTPADLVQPTYPALATSGVSVDLPLKLEIAAPPPGIDSETQPVDVPHSAKSENASETGAATPPPAA